MMIRKAMSYKTAFYMAELGAGTLVHDNPVVFRILNKHRHLRLFLKRITYRLCRVKKTNTAAVFKNH